MNDGMDAIISGLNFAVYEATQAIASAPLYHIMSYVVESYYVVLPAVMLYLLYKKDRNVFSFAFALVALYIIGDVIKAMVREPRPCAVGSGYITAFCDTGYSFPSNHATVLTGLFMFIKYKYLRALYLIWVAVVLFGKVFLAQHYFTDIVAGIIISIAFAKLVQVYSKRINGFFARIFNFVLGKVYKI